MHKLLWRLAVVWFAKTPRDVVDTEGAEGSISRAACIQGESRDDGIPVELSGGWGA